MHSVKVRGKEEGSEGQRSGRMRRKKKKEKSKS
jgi:hypothetical protein